MQMRCGFEEDHDPPNTARMQKFVASLWSTCAANNRARIRAGVELRAAVAEVEDLRRRLQRLQEESEACRRAAAEEAARHRATYEDRIRAATEAVAARLRAVAA